MSELRNLFSPEGSYYIVDLDIYVYVLYKLISVYIGIFINKSFPRYPLIHNREEFLCNIQRLTLKSTKCIIPKCKVGMTCTFTVLVCIVCIYIHVQFLYLITFTQLLLTFP